MEGVSFSFICVGALSTTMVVSNLCGTRNVVVLTVEDIMGDRLISWLECLSAMP